MNKKVQILQNESETEFHRVYKVSPTQQLTKLTHLLRESGEVVVNSCLHVSHLMLNLQEGTNDSEFVVAVLQSLLSLSL